MDSAQGAQPVCSEIADTLRRQGEVLPTYRTSLLAGDTIARRCEHYLPCRVVGELSELPRLQYLGGGFS